MGLFDFPPQEDEVKAKKDIIRFLVKTKYNFCLESCFRDNKIGDISSEEEVCLAICVDKLHRRYAHQTDQIYDILKLTAANIKKA